MALLQQQQEANTADRHWSRAERGPGLGGARMSCSPAVSGCCKGLVKLSQQVVVATAVVTELLNVEDMPG